LHTGDFRASSLLKRYFLQEAIDVLYLDTTYCHPKHQFPSQETVLDLISIIVSETFTLYSEVLIVIGCYSLGKENILAKIIQQNATLKIAVPLAKLKLLGVTHELLLPHFTTNHSSAKVHVLKIGSSFIFILILIIIVVFFVFNTAFIY
jgi:DNA cross-link repair 1A protein